MAQMSWESQSSVKNFKIARMGEDRNVLDQISLES